MIRVVEHFGKQRLLTNVQCISIIARNIDLDCEFHRSSSGRSVGHQSGYSVLTRTCISVVRRWFQPGSR
jgi:hypothetical protein